MIMKEIFIPLEVKMHRLLNTSNVLHAPKIGCVGSEEPLNLKSTGGSN